jgi:glycosyltransferase involved in cell wall biosynthesis
LAALDIADAVELAGYVPHEQLGSYLERAHIGFLAHDPLIYERNIPTKLFEYMAAGLPIVTTRAAMTAHFLEQAPAGVMVDSQDPRDYAQAIVDLWRDPERLHAMSWLGRQAFEQRYNWESEGQKLLALYQELAGQWASRKA